MTETWTYNARLQPIQIQLGSVFNLANRYDASSGTDQDCNGSVIASGIPGNNGNVLGQTVNGVGRLYSYDGANRLCRSQQGSTWTELYGFDTRGNIGVTRSGALPTATAEVVGSTSAYGSNNRVSSWAYDAAGNVTGIPAGSQQGSAVRASCASSVMPGVAMLRTACYDAENRMVSETDATGNTATYVYDGDGRRVGKTAGGNTTTFVYDPLGQLAQEYGGPPIPASETGTRYVTTDQLGSTRVLTKADGSVAQTYDYLAFGQEFTSSGDTNRIRFTSKERDAETGLDFFGARYFSAAQGRFTSPDKPFADQTPSDPQSWNLYSYVRNNPLRYIDPTGRDCVNLDNGTQGDDGKGTPCAGAQLGTSQTVTVGVGRDEANLIMLSMVGEGLGSPVGWADIGRHGMEGAMLAEGLWNLPGALRGGWSLLRGLSSASEMIPGLYGGVSRAALEAAASGGGETVKVVTNLTQAPAAGRGLSVAVGQSAEALAGAAGAARGGGTTYVAQIPKALINAMRGAGLVTESVTQMGGTAATELRFAPNAAEFVTKFFKPVQ